MARYKLADLSTDPFVLAMDQADDLKPIPEKFAAGWLSLAPTILQEWRSAGRTPPQFVYLTDKKVVYPMGELRRLMRELMEEAQTGSERRPDSQRPEPPNKAPTSAEARMTKITGTSDPKHLGLDQTLMRGGRRKGVKHATFASFLAEGQAEDEWVFAMIPDRSPGKSVRPVDLIETLRLELSDEQIEGATCEQLSLAEYLERSVTYHRDKPDRDRSAEREATLRAMAGGTMGDGQLAKPSTRS
ncbi:hypothetical protein [Dyella ginsengisoli]|uniref:hypothetical protein n=1 Tax=Dyella ginsengisoli TaxID=363848 RepID=UPI00034B1146|nr:hypothetical protein [Dyella ginsengisoli]